MPVLSVYYKFRATAKGGRSGWMIPLPALKGHFSADCSNANILNIVHLWNKINKIEYIYDVDLSLDHKVTSSVIIILKIWVSPRQPLELQIPEKGPKCEETGPHYQKGGYRTE